MRIRTFTARSEDATNDRRGPTVPRPVVALAVAGGLVASLAVGASASAAPGASRTASAAPAAPKVQQVGADTLPAYNPVPNEYIQHDTELETDTFSWGATTVSSYQVGRNYPTYGAQAIGYSTSTDHGATWTDGVLPGVTASSPHPNSKYPLAVNQSVAYSAKFKQWVIPSVTYTKSPGNTKVPLKETALLVNTSGDGLTWNDAKVAVATNVDKAWSTCDDVAASPYYGRCYVAYSQVDSANRIAVITSSDGGSSWSAPVHIAGPRTNTVNGYNTNLVAQRNGHVVLVFTDLHNGNTNSKMYSTVSTNGGRAWSRAAAFQTIEYHKPAGGIRGLNKPVVDVDGAGRVYAAWGDCRYRAGCAANDIVFASTTDGTHWGAPKPVSVDGPNSKVDHFIPGLAVEPGTSGGSAHLGVVYYGYPNTSCSPATCRVDVWYATSYNGGATWSYPYRINRTPMPLSWLATGNKGPLVGDYESTSFSGGRAVTVASVATAAPTTGSGHPTYHQSEYGLTLPANWARSQLSASRSPATITFGSRAGGTVSSQVRINGIPASGVRVQLQARSFHTARWVYNRTVTTNRNGVVSARVHPGRATSYRWYLPRSSHSVGNHSNAVTVAVRPTIGMYFSRARVRHGQSIVIHGSARPRIRHGQVLLQKLVHGRYRTQRHTYLDRTGHYRFRMTVHRGAARFHVLLKRSPGYTAGTSRALTVRGT